jgi:hypothetical protein
MPPASTVALAAPLRLPPAVAAVVAGRRRELVASAEGRVLDLDQAGAREALAAAMATGVDGASRYDTVLSTVQLARVADLHAALVAVAQLLAPDGRLLLLEPTARPARGGLLLGSAWARHPAVAGRHVNRDVTDALRHTPLSFCDLERITMPTRIWPLRSFVALSARPVPAPLADAAGDRS